MVPATSPTMTLGQADHAQTEVGSASTTMVDTSEPSESIHTMITKSW